MEPLKKKKPLFDEQMNYSPTTSDSSSSVAHSPVIGPKNSKAAGNLFVMTPSKPKKGSQGERGMVTCSSSASPSPPPSTFSLQHKQGKSRLGQKRIGRAEDEMDLDSRNDSDDSDTNLHDTEDDESYGVHHQQSTSKNEGTLLFVEAAGLSTPPSDQELLGDVLYALVGINGTHIHFDQRGPHTGTAVAAVVNPRAELRQRSVCEDSILPIATAYVKANNFANDCL